MSDLPHIPADFFRHEDPIPPMNTSDSSFLLYPDSYTQQSLTNDAPDEEEDIQDVLKVLLDLHEQSKQDNGTQQQFEENYLTVLKAVHYNEEMQNKVREQIELIDKQLDTNSKLLKQASLATLAENRFGQGFKIHKNYDNDINYFDEHELLVPICSEHLDTKQNADNMNPAESDLEENADGDEDDSEEDLQEDEEDEGDLADNGKPSETKAWSRHERERLIAGIQSEAKRMISFDYLKKNEAWRIWEVDKLQKKELEQFTVSRIDWDRISNLHVHSRSPKECLMQWTTQEHPSINKKPWSRQESQRLSELVEEIGLFSGQWERIAEQLNTNRTISQCFSHYMAEKNHASAKQLKWTPQEDKQLTEAVKIFGNCNWQQVASLLSGRTGQQCLHRYIKSLHPNIKRSKWTVEEDDLLRRAVQLYGMGNWTKVRRLVPGRTDMQCRERWCNILHPSVNRAPLSDEESGRLMALVEEHGPKWSFLARLMPGRTDNHLRRHYTNITSKDAREAKMREKKQLKLEREQKKKEVKEAKTKRTLNQKKPIMKKPVVVNKEKTKTTPKQVKSIKEQDEARSSARETRSSKRKLENTESRPSYVEPNTDEDGEEEVAEILLTKRTRTLRSKK